MPRTPTENICPSAGIKPATFCATGRQGPPFAYHIGFKKADCKISKRKFTFTATKTENQKLLLNARLLMLLYKRTYNKIIKK